MKKTININLAGMAFIIDEDAYIKLEKYMDTISYHFSKSEGCEDIITDIEARIAELFSERLKTKQIIGMKELDAIIAIMGKPEDFGAEPMEDDSRTRINRDIGIHPGKKLYRDTDHCMIGGVVSGIAAYFGIENILPLRFLWILFSFTGMGVLLYCILWAILPEAVTASDKLAMRGKPINVSNIAKTIEEEIEDLSQKINEFSNELTNRHRGKKKNKKDKNSEAEFNPLV